MRIWEFSNGFLALRDRRSGKNYADQLPFWGLHCPILLLVTLRAKLSGTVYCSRSCLWVCVFVGLLPR